MNNPKVRITIASGKGGVGKSMLTSCLAMLFAKKYNVVAVDCDVDAPNLAIWLNEIGNWKNIEKISTSEKPVFDYKKCNGCGKCIEVCKFNSLKLVGGRPVLNQFTCEGCGACEILCPQKAITLKPVKNGEIRIKKTKYGFPLITGKLFVGETGSGKVVTEVKFRADKFKYDIMLCDSAPGTGCPVIASLQDTDLAILVTEPTPSGFSDLNRVLEVVNHFKIPYCVIINKWDINKQFSKKIEKKFKNRMMGKISFDKRIFKNIANLKPILETNLPAKKEIKKIFNKLIKIL